MSNPVQQKLSWYYFLFNSSLGEIALMMNNFKILDGFWYDWTNGYPISSEELMMIKSNFKQNQNYKEIISYYKNAFTAEGPKKFEDFHQIFGKAKIDVPCLYLHGTKDKCILVEVARKINHKNFESLEYQELDSGHFPHKEVANHLNENIEKFIAN
jgi:pimeloyl-ACP methyl ester carboxylesterase